MDGLNRMRFVKFKQIAVWMLVGLIIATILPNFAQAQTPDCVQEIVVQEGESLTTIAARTLGTQSAHRKIIDATNAMAAVDASYARIDDPNTIIGGWKLCIPAGTPTAATENTNVEGAEGATGRGETDMSDSEMALEQDKSIIEAALAARKQPGVIHHPLSIEYLRSQEYPGSPLVIEQTLLPGSNYNRYLVSYQSEGLTIYGAMTVPTGEKPESGWPVILFNHGYIVPEIYSPTERYIEYMDAFARNGYIVLRPDYRGHGNSEGEAYGAYGDPGYTIDAINALASIKQYADADLDRIGMWGHSMGGYITARAMVVRDDIQAGVIWAGVVASYEGLLEQWRYSTATAPSTIAEGEGRWPTVLISKYGRPTENPVFWNMLSANHYVQDLSGPIQLHHGTADIHVPVFFSEIFYNDVIAAEQMAEYYVYEGDDHNISAQFDTAMRRTLAFFDVHVKNRSNSLPTLARNPTSNRAHVASVLSCMK